MSPADAPAGRLLAAERENVLVVFDIVNGIMEGVLELLKTFSNVDSWR